MANYVKSHEPGEKPVIRGKIIAALAILYDGPTVVASGEIDSQWYPAQPNNMVAWIRGVYKTLDKPFWQMFGAQNQFEYLVNDGVGPKEGRGSNQNRYTYILRDDNGRIKSRLDINITTESYAKIHAQKLAKGHVPRARANWSGVSHFHPGKNEYRIWVIDNWAELSKTDFQKRFPQWVGKLPVYGVDDPEQYRLMPQPSFDE